MESSAQLLIPVLRTKQSDPISTIVPSPLCCTLPTSYPRCLRANKMTNHVYHVINCILMIASAFKPPQGSLLDSEIPAIVGPQYCFPQQVHLTVASHILEFNNGNFVITDDNGNTLFKLDDKRIHLRDRTVLRDASDSPVLSFRKKSITLHDTYQVYRGESGDELFTLKDKHMIDHHEQTYEIQLQADYEPTFEVKGDFARRNYQIIFQGTEIVAEVTKKHHFSATALTFGKNKYNVVVNPNVDQAFVAAIVTIMDAIYEDNNEM
ncbi:hypothetical protein MPTK1_2g03620 [Marchantia polymorpha subsp. ruderalis]|uniref:Tubby C-terminal domain-containing protein n=1 Tax=Marchantia polymorpha TaxID=3197 RepID=A0A2R6X7F4_MARPO|nr:hypothetical protein MARPO_0031s0018 [Marchantia polymorpha]BBN00979.1 hypothetical protein Mp_2g03620 [Marchantia polymorpha subsp. ruderalis]|eukprot:PTQ42027.1 hypothetical protein MARPO_0031s0018 [Marchantia polymorpha]